MRAAQSISSSYTLPRAIESRTVIEVKSRICFKCHHWQEMGHRYGRGNSSPRPLRFAMEKWSFRQPQNSVFPKCPLAISLRSF
ncbi:hypothetical protein CUJ84_Chr001705 [Rhizobium leguminosarum]|uniref:Uncharacterized protein n=1 Tax=Rhizobium leguminosarum TaxID=384 RepID=A0A2K9Z1J3_RHILE|nr:hypothetical protein CUJ84_Chr001705 [Rhizobium leguminosarum]